MIQENGELVAEVGQARACAVLGMKRGSVYRWRQRGSVPRRSGRRAPDPPGMGERMEALCQQFTGDGYRRITQQLRREGFEVNHKRVRARLREAGWNCRVRRGKPAGRPAGETGLPNHLAQQGWRRLTGVNQAWVADLTYVPVGSGWGYLAVVLDAYSRKVVGWAFGKRADETLVLRALEAALLARQPEPGWIHHSDRGGQYTSTAYQARLRAAGARISFSAKGAPLENALVESFIGTVKAEEVGAQGYERYGEAAAALQHYLEEVYNRQRLHSALGYRPPIEYEQLYKPAIGP